MVVEDVWLGALDLPNGRAGNGEVDVEALSTEGMGSSSDGLAAGGEGLGCDVVD